MEENSVRKRTGIATFLDKKEIKDYFNTFFLLVGGIEFIVFIAHFIGSIGPSKSPFPWKQYFFIAFVAPVILIVLVGLIVIGFNYYVFGDSFSKAKAQESPFAGSKGAKLGHSLSYFFSVVRQIPVLLGFFVLILSSVVLYKFDAILTVVGHVGEKTAYYVFILLSVAAGGALIFLLFWLFWKFRLHKYDLKKQWEFKKQVMEKTGLIILDNNMVVSEDGKVIAHENLLEHIDADILDESEIPLIAQKLMSK